MKGYTFKDQRPDPKEWEEDFGDQKWNDAAVDDEFAKQSLSVLWNAMKGRKVHKEARQAAQFVAANKAWPLSRDPSSITINILRLEDLNKAKLKAGIMRVSKHDHALIEASDTDSEEPPTPEDR